MRIDGMLAKWNDDRGFGFIAPTNGGQEIFVHISAFPKDGQRPRLGEMLSFEIETGKDGKKRAKAVSRPARANAPHVRHRAPGRPRPKRSRLGQVVPLVVLVALGAYGYDKYSRRSTNYAAVNAIESAPNSSPSTDQNSSAGFGCDGRTHCSQMTSCAEATFFLRNCPDVQMDGDHDGVPCEEQWCTSWFAK
jgi:cold shock CspA family protein